MIKLIGFLKQPFRKKKQKGITLLEILAVLVIIALVFIALSRNLGFGSDKAKITDVQQAFKPYQVAFENSLNEQSGVVDTATIQRYLGADYQLTSTPALGTATDAKLKDPWNTAYKVQASQNATTGDLIIIRSAGKDKTFANANLAVNANNDDIVFVSHYKDGNVKSCTWGLEKNIGSVAGLTAGAGTITGCN